MLNKEILALAEKYGADNVVTILADLIQCGDIVPAQWAFGAVALEDGLYADCLFRTPPALVVPACVDVDQFNALHADVRDVLVEAFKSFAKFDCGTFNAVVKSGNEVCGELSQLFQRLKKIELPASCPNDVVGGLQIIKNLGNHVVVESGRQLDLLQERFAV